MAQTPGKEDLLKKIREARQQQAGSATPTPEVTATAQKPANPLAKYLPAKDKPANQGAAYIPMVTKQAANIPQPKQVQAVAPPKEEVNPFMSHLNIFSSRIANTPADLGEGWAIASAAIERGLGKLGVPGANKDLSARDIATYKGSENWRKMIDEVYPANQKDRESFLGGVMDGLGQIVPLALTAGSTAMPKAALQATKLGTSLTPYINTGKEIVKRFGTKEGVLAGSQVAAPSYKQAIEEGASEDEALRYAIENYAVGSVVENLPIQSMFSRIAKLEPKAPILNIVKEGVVGGSEEAVTEMWQTTYENMSANRIYDANKNIFEGIGEAGSIGGSVGFILNAATTALIGKRARTSKPEDVVVLDNAIQELEQKQEQVNQNNTQFAGNVKSLEASTLIGDGVGKFSYGSNQYNNKERRRVAGKVVIAQDKDTGEALEIMGVANPSKKTEGMSDGPAMYQAIRPNGKVIEIAEDQVGTVLELPLNDFNEILKSKAKGQAMMEGKAIEAEHTKAATQNQTAKDQYQPFTFQNPEGIQMITGAKYNGKEVFVTAVNDDGSSVISDLNGEKKVVQSDGLTEQETQPFEQFISLVAPPQAPRFNADSPIQAGETIQTPEGKYVVTSVNMDNDAIQLENEEDPSDLPTLTMAEFQQMRTPQAKEEEVKTVTGVDNNGKQDIEKRRNDDSDIKRNPKSDDAWHKEYDNETWDFTKPDGTRGGVVLSTVTEDGKVKTIEERIKTVKEVKEREYQNELERLKNQPQPPVEEGAAQLRDLFKKEEVNLQVDKKPETAKSHPKATPETAKQYEEISALVEKKLGTKFDFSPIGLQDEVRTNSMKDFLAKNAGEVGAELADIIDFPAASLRFLNNLPDAAPIAPVQEAIAPVPPVSAPLNKTLNEPLTGAIDPESPSLTAQPASAEQGGMGQVITPDVPQEPVGEGADGEVQVDQQTSDENTTYIREKIGKLFDLAQKVKDRVIKEFIRPVTKEEVVTIKEKTGIEIDEEFEHTIDNSAINHTLKKHGDQKKETKQGQLAVTKEDFGLVPDIIDNYDTIDRGEKNERGLDTVVYTKTYNDGTTYVVEEVRTGKKELALNTLYKRKKQGGLAPTENGIPPLTSETTPRSSPTNIPQKTEINQPTSNVPLQQTKPEPKTGQDGIQNEENQEVSPQEVEGQEGLVPAGGINQLPKPELKLEFIDNSEEILDKPTGKKRTVVSNKGRRTTKEETYRDVQNDFKKRMKALEALINCL